MLNSEGNQQKKKGTRRERKKKNRFIYSQVDLLPCESRHCLIGLLLKQVRSMAGEEEEEEEKKAALNKETKQENLPPRL